MRYLIRAIKYVAYFYAFFFLLYLVVHLVQGQMSTLAADLRDLVKPRLLVGLGILGALYPLYGFAHADEPFPQGDEHGQALRDILYSYGYALRGSNGAELTFRAISPARRVATMFEDTITITANPAGTITVAGLRKDVARVRLKLRDYVRQLKAEN